MKYSKRIWIHVILNKNSDHLKMWELKLHLNKRIWNFSLTSAHDYSLKNLVLSLSRLNPFSCVTLILPSSLVLSYSICSLCGGLFSLTVARSRSWCLKFIFLPFQSRVSFLILYLLFISLVIFVFLDPVSKFIQ